MFISKIIAFCFFLSSLYSVPENIYNPDEWIELTKIHITKNSPVQDYRVLWMNTYSQYLYPCAKNYPYAGDWSAEDRWMERYGWIKKPYPDNEWITISVADRVPENAKSIYLTGILIVSSGNSPQVGNMTVSFRRKGETKDYRHSHQSCICGSPEYSRSGVSVWVPLNEDKEFEFKWVRSTFGSYPDFPAYGMSIFLNGWGE